MDSGVACRGIDFGGSQAGWQSYNIGFRGAMLSFPSVTGLGHSSISDRELSRLQDRNRRCVSVNPADAEDVFAAR